MKITYYLFKRHLRHFLFLKYKFFQLLKSFDYLFRYYSLEMLDKIEPPLVPDGYGISVAYACLMEIIRSLQILINPQQQPEEPVTRKENNKDLNCQLINSSWCGLLAALSPLVDASTEESVTENVLKAIQTYTSLCGMLDLHTPRDAFITAICKSSLPPHYALTVLNTVTSGVNLRQGWCLLLIFVTIRYYSIYL